MTSLFSWFFIVVFLLLFWGCLFFWPTDFRLHLPPDKFTQSDMEASLSACALKCSWLLSAAGSTPAVVHPSLLSSEPRLPAASGGFVSGSSSWLGGVLHKGSSCSPPIRWNCRCVDGGVCVRVCVCFLVFPCRAVTRDATSGGVGAPCLCCAWMCWGVFDRRGGGGTAGRKRGTWSASGTVASPAPFTSLVLFFFFFFSSTQRPRVSLARFSNPGDDGCVGPRCPL